MTSTTNSRQRSLIQVCAVLLVAACGRLGFDGDNVDEEPAAVTATFGYPTIGASWGIFVGNGIKAVNRFSLAEAGSVTKLSIYVDGNGGPTGTGLMKGIIYADASGQPGALVATASEISVASGAAAGWRDLTFASPVSLSAGSYFLGVHVGGTANVIRETYDIQTGIMRYDADPYADGASNPYGTATAYDNKMSLYATYTAAPKTFGYPTVGASWGIFVGNGIKAVDRFALGEAGNVTKLSIYVDGNGGPTGTGLIKGILYADASGQPGALLATSSEVSVTSGAAAGWRDLTFASPVSLSAGSYFLGVLVGGTANVIRETYDVQTGIMRYDADAYADGASNPYGTATTYNNKMSLYATYGGGSGGGGDTTPPVITAVGASAITTSGATITWTTNEASTSQVDYGTTTSYGATSALDGSLVASHSRALTGLVASTQYHYRVRSRDAAGNLAVSSDATFTTIASSPSGGLITNFTSTKYTDLLLDGVPFSVLVVGGKSYSLQEIDDHTLRFEVRQGDCVWSCGSVETSEISRDRMWAPATAISIEYQFMLEPGATLNSPWFVVGEMHNDDYAWPQGTSPPFAMQLGGPSSNPWAGGEYLQVVYRYDQAGGCPTNSCGVPTIFPWVSSSPIVRGQWYNIKVQANFSNTGGGYLRVWVNGSQVVNYNGLLGYGYQTYWMYGLYRQTSSVVTAAQYRNMTVLPQ